MAILARTILARTWPAGQDGLLARTILAMTAIALTWPTG